MKIRVMSIALLVLFLTASIAASPPCPSSFSIPQPDVTDIAVDDTDVYFSHGGFIRRVSKEGGSPIAIAKLSGKWVMYLVTDDTNVYFAARDNTDRVDAVYRISKNGGAATLLVRGNYAAEMIPDGDWLYIAYPGLPAKKIPGQIIRVKKDGSAIEPVVTGLRMTMGMLLEGEWIYFGEADGVAGGIRRVSKNGGPVTRIADIPGVMALTQDAANLYAVRLPERAATIVGVAKSDGRVTRLVSGVSFEVLEPLEFRGESLYFGHLAGRSRARIDAIRPPRGERRTVAEFKGGFPRIAVDECGVYYSTEKGIERSGL